MYKVILFDLDGTLTESGEGITKSVQYALERIGKPEADLEKLKVFVGPPLTEMFMKYAQVDEETAKKQMRSLVPYVDIMKISDEETKLLTDKESPEEATEILFRKGVKIVAVTLGSDGAYLYCKEGGVHIPGFVSKAVDTNGAGDSFWGGFLYCISKAGKRPEAFTMDELKEYVRFGNAVASLCVERKGAIPAMPELAQVEERMGR